MEINLEFNCVCFRWRDTASVKYVTLTSRAIPVTSTTPLPSPGDQSSWPPCSVNKAPFSTWNQPPDSKTRTLPTSYAWEAPKASFCGTTRNSHLLSPTQTPICSRSWERRDVRSQIAVCSAPRRWCSTELKTCGRSCSSRGSSVPWTKTASVLQQLDTADVSRSATHGRLAATATICPPWASCWTDSISTPSAQRRWYPSDWPTRMTQKWQLLPNSRGLTASWWC